MSSFTDARGRKWSIDLDTPTARQIKSELHLDLINPSKDLMERLRSDVGLLVDLLEILCRDQRVARKLYIESARKLELDPDKLTPDEQHAFSIKEFARSLKGEALELATDAFLEDYMLFCPQHRRTAMQAALRKMKDLEERQTAHLLQTINGPEMEARFQRELDQATRELITGISSTAGAESPATTLTAGG